MAPPGNAPKLVWNGRAFVPARPAPPKSQVRNPVVQALLGNPPAAAAPPTGPYQGAAGSEMQHPGQPRTPTADWADPNSPNYERRNYYQLPDGTTVVREPGYYNPDNPFDTGRPGEKNRELGRGEHAPWDASYERRMDEPGITPWGPQGHPSAPGAFTAPGGAAPGAAQHPKATPDILKALLGGSQSPVGGALGAGASQQLPAELIAFLQALMGRNPQNPVNPVRGAS